jgi:hypothetical protein
LFADLCRSFIAFWHWSGGFFFTVTPCFGVLAYATVTIGGDAV